LSLLVRSPDTFTAERRWVLDLILGEWLGLDHELAFEARADTSIESRGGGDDRRLRIAEGLFATSADDWLTERSIPRRPLPHWTAAESMLGLPILFGANDAEGQWIRRTPTETELLADVLGGAFFMLTRYEEYVGQGRDGHQRFPATASLAWQEGFLDRPIVDEYVDRLWSELRALWPELVRRSTTFRLRLSHDVDRPWAAVGQSAGLVAHAVAGDLIRRRDPVLAARRARAILDTRSGRVDRDPFNTFDLLMDTSERHGLHSTFYFMTGATDSRYDGSYKIDDPPVRRLLRRAHDRGHEIGLHASYHTFRSGDQMRIELDALTATCESLGIDQAAWGVRQHFLRFEAPGTWGIQAGAGLSHDSTLGFADENGFRGGTCREYPVFDLAARQALGLRERPLIFMDAASRELQAFDYRAAASRARALVATCRRHAGDAVLLYHNSSLPGAGPRAHYRELIESLVQPA
jgi:hypothetical protein